MMFCQQSGGGSRYAPQPAGRRLGAATLGVPAAINKTMGTNGTDIAIPRLLLRVLTSGALQSPTLRLTSAARQARPRKSTEQSSL